MNVKIVQKDEMNKWNERITLNQGKTSFNKKNRESITFKSVNNSQRSTCCIGKKKYFLIL